MKEALINFLRTQPPGNIEDALTLSRLTAPIWKTLEGSSEQRTKAYKLVDRMETPCWEPPVLRFTIERHGRTAGGSSRADLHTWEIDIETWTARLVRQSYRQLWPTAPRLNVRLLAEQVAKAILEGSIHAWIEHKPDGSVRMLISKVIPMGDPTTTKERRKRFRGCLAELLNPQGWSEPRYNHWVHSSPTGSLATAPAPASST